MITTYKLNTNHVKNQSINSVSVQQLAWCLLLIFCYGLFKPTLAIAGGGGPTQPEVQGFTPVGVSDMVDPFTGDFTYNIPLMDVEGYPINIAYNSGITMDQEASWVGLGWNLNMGSIVRSMRGLPDDFNGDVVVKTEVQKPRVEFGLNASSNWEIFGKKNEKGVFDSDTAVDFPSLKAGLQFTYSNYTGYGTALDFGPSFSLGKIGKTGLGADLSFSGSSENGAGFSAGVSLSNDIKLEDLNEGSLTNSVGGGLNSRAGLTYLSYGMTANGKVNKDNVLKSKTFPLMSSSYNVGAHTYYPSSQTSFLSQSSTGNISWTATVMASDVQFTAGLFINTQIIDPAKWVRHNPAYGYFNLDKGQSNDQALLDFNRDNEGSFTKYTPNLASTYLTNDIFSIQAQGIAGSYRAYRNEIGYVFDPRSESHSSSGNLGLEFGGGNLIDGGIDLTGSVVNSHSGPWTSGTNHVAPVIKFEDPSGLQESDAFQEANERSVDTDALFVSQIHGGSAEHLKLEGSDMWPKLTAKTEYNGTGVSTNNRSERLKRNQLMSYLTIGDIRDGLGLYGDTYDVYDQAEDHHIGEITQLGTDGRRYVFGIPLYNYGQEEVTFSVGEDLGGDGGYFPADDYSGIVDLGNDFNEAASTANKLGIDQHYSSQQTPGYAHSFMLSAVLSDDYVDSDNTPGPSANDLGSYVSFDYEKFENVHWRTPVGKNEAYHNPGLKTDLTDDKASFVYGEKEVQYVKTVETKNYIAVFDLDDRQDGISSNDRTGGLNPDLDKMQCLKKISLYAKPAGYNDLSDLAGLVPIQEVHFVYDYSLCQGYPGHISGGGKLTLKEIYFTYQGSYKLKRSSYRFDYDSPNANYNMKAVDRWGTYQPTGSGLINYTADNSKLNTSDFPYTVQDSALVNSYSQQWTLTDIHLPSGGKIHVDYESDDYAFVQHLQASQMYPIVATGTDSDAMNNLSLTQPRPEFISNNTKKNRSIFFKLKPGYTKKEDYFLPGQPIYFKCLVNMNDANAGYDALEYISGYAYVDNFSVSGDYGKVTLRPTKLLDNGSADYNPITKAAILFGRMNMQRSIYDIADMGEPSANENSVSSFASSIVNAGASFKEYFTGPNGAVYDQEKCQELVTQHSFIRLLEPTGHKYGGGLRVKRITMFDNWAKMENSGDPDNTKNFTYGQEFNYNLEDGKSSGVASYEPLIGGDENSWKKATAYNEEFMFAPDNELFLSGPIMESQFPNPSVGYSRVTITDLKHDNVTRTATGKVVKEFYTARDFPTLTSKTLISKGNNSNSMKIETSFLPLLPKYDYLTVSQGFSIETNDMHGKPKSEAVYSEGQTTPLSTVHYDYQKTAIVDQGIPCFQLENEVTTIQKNGETEQAEIGVKYDAVSDFRESVTNSLGVGPIEVNTNSFLAGPALLVIPSIWAKIDISRSQFRSATLNKTVNRFGVLNKVTANQDGSIVETNNLAYDAETGDVLATQTTTNFEDRVYSLNVPAHWKYDRMGQAYQNINYEVSGYPIYADGLLPVPGAQDVFVEGDELEVDIVGGEVVKGWVSEVNAGGIRILDKSGQPITASSTNVRIIRSGRRNKQSTSIAAVTALDNPITGLSTEVYAKVLNAGAVEFNENWKTYCECFGGERDFTTTNPFVNGTRGNWRPVRSFTYLTDRTQTQYNNNTNIRRDGVFSSFSPYYYYHENEWRTSPANWTFVSKVTEFSPNGMTLETQDALGRYSASLFSFNNTLTTAVAANSQLRQIAEGSFEDLDYSGCTDQGVFSKLYESSVSQTESHTGRSSLKVGYGQTKQYADKNLECEDEVGCDIQIVPTSANTYSVSGEFDTFEVTPISGEEFGSVSLVEGVLTVSFTGTGYYAVECTFIDKEGTGCQVKIRINTVLPGNNQLNMQVLSTGQN